MKCFRIRENSYTIVGSPWIEVNPPKPTEECKKENYKPQIKISWKVAVLIFCVTLIMVLSKLLPFIPSSWSDSFCIKWNDFWFAISSNLFTAIILYYLFTLLLQKIENEQNRQFVQKSILDCVHHALGVYAMFKGKYCTDDATEEETIKELCSFDWFEKVKYAGDYSAQTFAELLSRELFGCKKHLEEIVGLYGHHINITDLKYLLNLKKHSIFQWIDNIMFPEESKKVMFDKEHVARTLFDFYSKLYKYAIHDIKGEN